MGRRKGLNYHEYIRSPQWKNGWRRKLSMKLMFGCDALLPFLPATQADHITYRNLGHELPFRDLIPLHPVTHAFITFFRLLCRNIFGRKLGNFLVAWAMRAIVVFWWLMPIWCIRQLVNMIAAGA